MLENFRETLNRLPSGAYTDVMFVVLSGVAAMPF